MTRGPAWSSLPRQPSLFMTMRPQPCDHRMGRAMRSLRMARTMAAEAEERPRAAVQALSRRQPRVGVATLAVTLVLIAFRRSAQMCYRCPTCKQCWPNDDLFRKCPVCKAICWRKEGGSGDDVMSLREALQAKAHADFDR